MVDGIDTGPVLAQDLERQTGTGRLFRHVGQRARQGPEFRDLAIPVIRSFR